MQCGVIGSMWVLGLKSVGFEPQLYDLFCWLTSNNLKFQNFSFQIRTWKIKLNMWKNCGRNCWLAKLMLFQILFSLAAFYFQCIVHGNSWEGLSFLTTATELLILPLFSCFRGRCNAWDGAAIWGPWVRKHTLKLIQKETRRLLGFMIFLSS